MASCAGLGWPALAAGIGPVNWVLSGHSVRVTVLNRPICLHRSSERKRFKIKQIGRFQSVYLVQSVHAPLTYIIRESYSHAGIMIGQINARVADVVRRRGPEVVFWEISPD